MTKENKKTIAQIFGMGINQAAEKLRIARKKISGNNSAKKLSGVCLLWTVEYAMKSFNKLLVDNKIIRSLENNFSKIKQVKNKNGENEKISKFLKENPWILSYLTYYIMTYSIIAGAGKITSDVLYDFFENTKENVMPNAFEKINPKSKDFIEQCIKKENTTSIGIIYTETYRKTPKVQSLENVWTVGFGMTWSPNKKGDMTIRNYADTKQNKKNGYKPHKPEEKNIDTAIKETQSFLRTQIYPKIKKNITREISENELYALCIAGYQLSGHLPTICRQLSAAKSPQEIADAFITKSMYKYGGTPKRRWVCAMIAAGFITIEDILDADIDAFYMPDDNIFIHKGHFVCDAKTINYVLSLKKKGTTRAVVEKLKDGEKKLSEFKNRTKTIKIKNDFNIAKSKLIKKHTDKKRLVKKSKEK